MELYLAQQITDEREDILNELEYQNRLFSYFYALDKKHEPTLSSLQGVRLLSEKQKKNKAEVEARYDKA